MNNEVNVLEKENGMELKIDKTTKILLGLIAFGLFLNASDTYINKAFANQIQPIAICDMQGNCAGMKYGDSLKINNNGN